MVIFLKTLPINLTYDPKMKVFWSLLIHWSSDRLRRREVW